MASVYDKKLVKGSWMYIIVYLPLKQSLPSKLYMRNNLFTIEDHIFFIMNIGRQGKAQIWLFFIFFIFYIIGNKS